MELKATKYAIDGPVATLTLSRPNRRNAWTGRMHTELRWVLEQAEQDTQVRVIVITGEGRDFCVGADSQALEGHGAKGRLRPGHGP
ncbi:enoyl-CoA hydratase/isomerase family protein [Candidatus Poriferisodalis sp.]|uniref:enoyl-CoA hydratase/isomerase family protein n=1 Tax=Candidatus Poriferisodalis sp. TaxID=3101277 RepID=UPI003C6F0358